MSAILPGGGRGGGRRSITTIDGAFRFVVLCSMPRAGRRWRFSKPMRPSNQWGSRKSALRRLPRVVRGQELRRGRAGARSPSIGNRRAGPRSWSAPSARAAEARRRWPSAAGGGSGRALPAAGPCPNETGGCRDGGEPGRRGAVAQRVVVNLANRSSGPLFERSACSMGGCFALRWGSTLAPRDAKLERRGR